MKLNFNEAEALLAAKKKYLDVLTNELVVTSASGYRYLLIDTYNDNYSVRIPKAFGSTTPFVYKRFKDSGAAMRFWEQSIDELKEILNDEIKQLEHFINLQEFAKSLKRQLSYSDPEKIRDTENQSGYRLISYDKYSDSGMYAVKMAIGPKAQYCDQRFPNLREAVDFLRLHLPIYRETLQTELDKIENIQLTL